MADSTTAARAVYLGNDPGKPRLPSIGGADAPAGEGLPGQVLARMTDPGAYGGPGTVWLSPKVCAIRIDFADGDKQLSEVEASADFILFVGQGSDGGGYGVNHPPGFTLPDGRSQTLLNFTLNGLIMLGGMLDPYVPTILVWEGGGVTMYPNGLLERAYGTGAAGSILYSDGFKYLVLGPPTGGVAKTLKHSGVNGTAPYWG